MSEAYVTKAKREQLEARMRKLGITDDELVDKFILGSGSGGQKVNKTSSCVQLQHKAMAIEIRCQKTRSQADNRYWARSELCDRIEERELGDKSKKQQAFEKIRRQKRRRSRRAKSRMLDDKAKQGSKKKLRGSVRPDD